MSTSATVLRATSGDIDAASTMLSRAFDNYLWTRWSVPEDGYAERLRGLQGLYLSYALNEGVVLVAGPVDGVIALLSPDVAAPSEEFQ
ncbi:MAG: hypothetical protein ACTH1D_00380 [Mycobacteriaceae bacterium]|uniref:hypothetical protein n=1 Tax=Corynebacterium sp. TaxID=1720 RepID=UPI003F955144